MGLDEEHFNRRELFRRILAAAVTGSVLVADVRNAFAERVQSILCNEVQGGGNLLDKACDAEINDPEAKALFIESLRNVPAFEEFAQYLPKTIDLSSRKLRILYPGSGFHMAPVALAASLIREGSIDEAVFTYTEIDECHFIALSQNLKLLPNLDPDFVFAGESKPIKCKGTKEGKEYVYKITYRGKPIQIRFLVECSGEEWFRDQEFRESDLMVFHDSISGLHYETTSAEFFMPQIFPAREKAQAGPSSIIIEDPTRMNPTEDTEHRQRLFDIELFGRFIRGTKPYGCRPLNHRVNVDSKHFSKLTRCYIAEHTSRGYVMLPERSMININPDNFERAYRFNCKGGFCDGNRSRPDSVDISTEQGKTLSRNAVLLKIHPELFTLTADDIENITAVSRLAHRTSLPEAEYSFVHDNDVSEREYMSTSHRAIKYYNEILAKASKFLTIFSQIDPALRRGLAVRLLQMLAAVADNVVYKIRYRDDFDKPDIAEEIVIKDTAELQKYLEEFRQSLDSSDQQALQEELQAIDSLINAQRDIMTKARLETTKADNAWGRESKWAIVDCGYIKEPQKIKAKELRERLEKYGDQIFESLVD